MSRTDLADLLFRLFVDLSALAVLTLIVARRRARRGLATVLASFNVGVFVVLTVITTKHVGPAVGFGLFAMLSIVRLRSEPFGNAELAAFFAALVLALANGVPLSPGLLSVGLSALVLAGLWLVDHPALYPRTARQRITLDEALTDPAEVRAALHARLGAEIVDVSVEETDFVRETTIVTVRCVVPDDAPAREPMTEALA